MSEDQTIIIRGSLRSKGLWWGLSAVLACLLLLALAWAVLQTRWAKNRLGAWVASLTAETPGYRAALEGLDGLIPFSIVLNRLTLSDAEGVWLEGRNVNISVSPSALLLGRVDVGRFLVEGLSISRLPESGATPADTSSGHPGSAPLFIPSLIVREMRIDRIDIGAWAAGTPLSYRLESTVQSSDSELEVMGLFQDLQRPDDAWRLIAAYDRRTKQVHVEATCHESRGGPVAGLMGLSRATGIHFHTRVDGPIQAAKGQLTLDVGGYGTIDSGVEAGLERPFSLALEGQVRVDPSLVPAEIATGLGGLEGDLKCRAHISLDQKIHIRRFTLSVPSGAMSVEGSLDLAAGFMDLAAIIFPLNLSQFFGGSGISLDGPEAVRFAVKGPFAGPEITVDATLKRCTFKDTALEDVTLEAHGAFGTDYEGFKRAETLVRVGQMKGPWIPDLSGPFHGGLTAASTDFTRWDVKRLQLAGPGITLTCRNALIDMESGLISGDLAATADRMALLLPLKPANVDGSLAARARVEGNVIARQARADLNMDLTHLSGLPAPVAAAIGPGLALKAIAAVNDGIITLEEAHLSASRSEFATNGRLDLLRGAWDVQYRISLEELSPIGEVLGMGLSGPAAGHGRFSGQAGEIEADIALSSEALRVNDLDLKGIQVRLEAKDLARHPSGLLHMKGAAMDQPFELHAGATWSDDGLSVSGLKAALPGIDLDADVVWGVTKPQVVGTAGGDIRSLELLNTLFGMDMEGKGRFRFTSGGPAGPGALSLNADFKALRYKEYSVPFLHIAGRLDDPARLQGRLTLKAADAVFKDLRLTEVRAELEGSPDKAAIDVETKGSFRGKGGYGQPSHIPVSLSAGLHTAYGDGRRIRMDRFKVLCGGEEIVLVRPATVTQRGREADLDALELSALKGRLDIKGSLNQDRVQASGRIIDLPLTALTSLIGRPSTGTLSAAAEVSGPLADPDVHGSLEIQGYSIPRENEMPPILLDASLKANRNGDRFDAELMLSGLDPSPFIATASLPGSLSLRPFSFDPDKNANLRGRLHGRLDLSVLKGLPEMDDQTLRGDVEVDMAATGSMENWGLKGGIAIHNGHYENPASGTILTHINGRIEADGRDLKVERLTATDGEAGTIGLKGGIATIAPFPIEAELVFQQTILLRKKSAVSTATGRLDLRGNPERIDMTGKITLDRTELEIPKHLPPDLVVIPVKEINLPPGMTAHEVESPQGAGRLFMDIGLTIPARFFVRGRGLDAEFKGDLTAQGPAQDPVIRGRLSVVRGAFQFMTRTFHIAQGEITFDGARPPVPLLNITAQVNAGQIEAQVQVTGPADDFKLKLTSQPHLPQDEIMANILFNQSVARLNAFQAYQLAASISRLSGGDMPDIVGKTRGLLGVDRLSISGGDNTQNAERGPAVSVGKYVSEGVYVGVEQELTDAKQDVVVELDITPHFSVESRAGTRSGAGVGFNWKYDY